MAIIEVKVSSASTISTSRPDRSACNCWRSLAPRSQKSAIAEKPFFLYLAFGATHAPHQAPQSYVDKYKGRFDAGWDAIRQQWYERQKELGIIPPNTELAPRNPGVAPWDELPDTQKKLALKLQE
ncbi:sulfatase-like hydrolase/transferase, partial [Pseudomonas aeruginosa]|uniref:sulfatase-like hydrolase/transferase n=1 Tax=Pseudomonas aeruginosa TaxID=287 RepID=UPI00188CF6EA